MYTQEDNYGAVFVALDKLFLTVFVLEILVKWYNDFLGFWTTSWNVFDFVIVAASILGPSELGGGDKEEKVALCYSSTLATRYTKTKHQNSLFSHQLTNLYSM